MDMSDEDMSDKDMHHKDEEDNPDGEMHEDYIDDIEVTKLTRDDFEDYGLEANRLIAAMKYMDKMAHHPDKEHDDCIYYMISYRAELLQPALEVMKMKSNHVDDGGNNPLFAAMDAKSPYAIMLLLKNHCDPFRCNYNAEFAFDDITGNSADAILCRQRMNVFLDNFVLGRQSDVKHFEDKAVQRMRKVKKYGKLIEGLSDILFIKNKISNIIDSDTEFSADLKKVRELMDGLDAIAEILNYTSVPGVTLLQAEPKVEESYIDDELCRLNWSKDIEHYFTLGVERMTWLERICKHDTRRFHEDIGALLKNAEDLLTNCKRPRER